eukprot:2622189-Prymnesium_polylepis.1
MELVHRRMSQVSASAHSNRTRRHMRYAGGSLAGPTAAGHRSQSVPCRAAYFRCALAARRQE